MSIALDIFKDAKEYKTFAPGETIFEEGQEGEFMYVILEGEVEISKGDSPIDNLSAGDIFGEMALVDDSPRSAKARAVSDCRVVPVNQFDFTYYVQHSPFFALNVMSIMAKRLRRQLGA